MSNSEMFDEAFPEGKQIGGSHYKNFDIQPYEFISRNKLSFFQGCVVKYVKNKIYYCNPCAVGKFVRMHKRI